MPKKSAKSTPKSPPTPREIVDAWHKEFEKALKPWSIDEDKNLKEHKSKMQQKITELLGQGAVFGAADMKNSLRVARDAAKMCQILQPPPHPKKVAFDTLQLVLRACAKGHMVCSGTGGGGGWCDT